MRKRIITLISQSPGKRLRLKDLKRLMKIRSDSINDLKRSLSKLQKDGKILKRKGHWYKLRQEKSLMEGTLLIKNKGFGFVTIAKDKPDIFVSRRSIKDALDGDRVEVWLHNKNNYERLSGTITKVVSRKTDRLIGTVTRINRERFLSINPITPARGIKIIPDREIPVEDGDLVVTRVVNWGSAVTPVSVKVVKAIGQSEDPEIDFQYILNKYGYSQKFSQTVEKEAIQYSQQNILSEIPNREDLTPLTVFTIDPKEARDFDDGLSIEEVNTGYRLGVHIADVSHFVQSRSNLDKAAEERGNSVYFSEGVVHMLPEVLSANLCSLVPNKRRLSVSALIGLNHDYSVRSLDVKTAVIESRKRFTYQDVQSIIDGEKQDEFERSIILLHKIAKTLNKRRSAEGSIDFDIPEPIIMFQTRGIPHEIRPSERLDSHRLVEECMLLANKLIAVEIHKIKNKVDGMLYRIHDRPDKKNSDQFLYTVRRLGISIPNDLDPGTPKGLRAVLTMVEDSPFHSLIETLALRSMMKAQYSPHSRSHFGLAFDHYTHFTSPIRRYADLLVHRLVKRVLCTDYSNLEKISVTRRSQAIAEHINGMELLALQAEREYLKIKQLRWLNMNIGKSFEGLISGVVNFGFFVELNDSLAEGLVHIDNLDDDDYNIDEDGITLRGRKYGQIYRLGDRMKIIVSSVSIEKQRADFKLS
jgi:ribonuclease R